jgi:hypothetical protein
MRRFATLIAASLLILAVAAPAAAQPERTWLEPETIHFEGYCPFPVLLEDDAVKVKELAFPPDAEGDQRLIYPGFYKSTLTNLATGASIRIMTSGSVNFTIRADGTASASGHGRTLVWYTAADAPDSDLGQGLFIVRGVATETYDADFNVTSATYRGTVRDICAELAGDS